jgi:hypothetical protein
MGRYLYNLYTSTLCNVAALFELVTSSLRSYFWYPALKKMGCIARSARLALKISAPRYKLLWPIREKEPLLSAVVYTHACRHTGRTASVQELAGLFVARSMLFTRVSF